MKEHEQGIKIIEAVQKILADVPGTLLEHQQRINSMNFLRQRLEKLDQLENQMQVETPME